MYSASEENFSPENTNPYLLQLLMPHVVSGIPIPDGNPTPMMMKTLVGEYVSSWVDPNAELLTVWTPASPSYPLTFFVKLPGTPWSFLGRLNYNQPLFENWQKARLAAARLVIQSAAMAIGVVNLAGVTTTAYVDQIPAFTGLNYNTILSYIPNAGVFESAVPVETGTVALYQPNGYTEFWTPDSASSLKVEDYWESTWQSPNLDTDGWVVPAGGLVVPSGSTGILWDSNFAPAHSGSDTALPDPFYGYCRFEAEFDCSLAVVGVGASTYLFSIWVEAQTADPVTWVNITTRTRVATARMNGGNLTVHFSMDSAVIDVTGLITRVYLELQNDGPNSVTLSSSRDTVNWITVTSHDYLRPNVMSPATLSITTRINTGQPVSLSFVHTLELVPRPRIARVVQLSTNRLDDILLEEALAVLSHIGKGTKMVWKLDDYDRAIAMRYFHNLAQEKTAFEAAGPSLKSRMMELWKKVNPYISEAAISGGKHILKGALSNAGLVHPALGPVGSVIAREFLSAPAPGEKEWMAADVEEPSGLASRTSDFVNIVNVTKAGITGPRSAYFPVVPKSLDKDPKILFVHVSKAPLGESEYAYTSTNNGAGLYYNAFFEGAETLSYLGDLTNYAVSCDLITKQDNLYFTVKHEAVDGSSWRLAALAALMGIGGGLAYSGSVEFVNPLRPVLKPVGRTATKAELCRRLGKTLVLPSCIDDTEIGSLIRIGPVAFSGYLASGKELPKAMSAFLVESVWDASILGLRAFKHRVNKPVDYQMQVQVQSPGYNPQTKKPAPVSKLVQARLPEYTEMVDRLADDLIDYTERKRINNPAMVAAINKAREGWKGVLRTQGNSQALDKQMELINAAAKKQYEKIDNYYKNSVVATVTPVTNDKGEPLSKSQRARLKRKAAAERRLKEAEEEASYGRQVMEEEDEENAAARSALGF